MITEVDRPEPEEPGAWLDFGQAAALLGLSMPRIVQLLDDHALPSHPAPTGRPGVMKSDLMAWHRRDQAERRDALIALARAVDEEVFG